MSKANSNVGKSTANGSVNNNTSAGTKHHRKPRKNSHGAVGTERDTVAEVAGGSGGGERSTAGRDYPPTQISHSQATTGARRDQLQYPSRVFYENTFRIDPQVHVDVQHMEKLIHTALLEQLKGRKYVAADCKWLTQDLAADLLERVKSDQRDAGVRRYKFVSVVNIGSVTEHPDVQLASRCLWVPNTDGFASASYSNDSLFAVATVYAVYHE